MQWEVTAQGHGVSFAITDYSSGCQQLCEYKNHWIVYFQMGELNGSKLYHNKKDAKKGWKKLTTLDLII